MLDWKTVDPKATYPRPRYRAVDGESEFTLHAEHDGWWHLLWTRNGTWEYSVNCRAIDSAKAVAERWALEVVTA
jgi:hypothetical protein